MNIQRLKRYNINDMQLNTPVKNPMKLVFENIGEIERTHNVSC